MLQKIRDNIQGTLAKIVLAAIIIPFALFGIDAFFTGGVPDAARVDGEVITEPELAQGIELERRRLMGQMQDRVDASLLEESRLRKPVLESLIERRLLMRAASEGGLRVGDAMLNQLIVDNESFQENGEFSQARFQGLLANNGMSPAQFKSLLREDILVSQLLSGIEASEFVTTTELGNTARLTQQSLDARWLVVPVPAADASIEVAQEQVAGYYEQHRQEFRTEETVRVDYLELQLTDLYQPVDEAALHQEYEHRIQVLQGAEERHAAHIMLASQDDDARGRLAALRDRVLAGEDFAALAREYSEDPGSASTGGDLGFSQGDTFPPEFEAALKSLTVGEISEPVLTGSGWHLIKLIEVRKPQLPSFAEMRATIEKDLQKAAAEPLFVERAERLADLTFNSDDLSEAAQELGLEIHASPAFGRHGGEGLFADARVAAAAFSREVLEERQNSERIDIGDDHVLVLRLASHEPAREQELPEVAERIRTLLREGLVRQQAEARADVLLAALRGGQRIEDLAHANGLEWKAVPGYTRGGSQAPEVLGRALFDTPRDKDGAGWGKIVGDDGEVLVFEFEHFREGDVARLAPEQRSMLEKVFRRAQGMESVEQYRQRIRAVATVELP